MQKIVSSRMNAPRRRLASFTLIELLTVIAIIAILATLVLAAASGLETQAERKRAMAEIDGMSNSLESYKRDNGAYPTASSLVGPPNGNYQIDPTPNTVSGMLYMASSEALYTALSGGLTTYGGTTAPTGTVYYPFSKKQLGNANASGPTYAQDPWGYPYGYSTGDGNLPPVAQVQYPNRGSGFFDLWTTGGATATTGSTNNWVVNWQ
jgi:prepilin-type N-terminal cleavage/methylation domain-containing protein